MDSRGTILIIIAQGYSILMYLLVSFLLLCRFNTIQYNTIQLYRLGVEGVQHIAKANNLFCCFFSKRNVG